VWKETKGEDRPCDKEVEEEEVEEGTRTIGVLTFIEEGYWKVLTSSCSLSFFFFFNEEEEEEEEEDEEDKGEAVTVIDILGNVLSR
jgi:hypothetical protein